MTWRAAAGHGLKEQFGKIEAGDLKHGAPQLDQGSGNLGKLPHGNAECGTESPQPEAPAGVVVSCFLTSSLL